jgi:hypothetical protein
MREKGTTYLSVQIVRVDTSFEIDSLKDVSVYIFESLNIYSVTYLSYAGAPPPPPRWRGSVSYCDVTGKSTPHPPTPALPTVTQHATPLLTLATSNRQRYKKPAEQYAKLICDQEPPKRVCD